METTNKINEDLLRERAKCTFDIEELTNIIDGGKETTTERRKLVLKVNDNDIPEQIVLSLKELRDKVPEEYLSYKERYENAVRKVVNLIRIAKDYYTRRPNSRPSTVFRISNSVVKDVSPMLLHFGMFVPTIEGQATEQQQAQWLPRAKAMEIIGTYAQTELGHGTFLRGLETTATYDEETQQFELHTPTLTAYKWWPGGLGHTANYCIVVAQLYSKGVCHGVHPFIVQIRDEETHEPMPGITLGDTGPKLGFQTANNGFLAFNKVRVTRDAMLMKNAQVLKDGTYVKGLHSKLAYGTMVMVRVFIVTDVGGFLSKAVTIAVRYSAVRHQSKPKDDEPEPQILDYLTQQHKLFIGIATAHAYRECGRWLWDAYFNCISQLKEGNVDQLPELHAIACCLKATTTAEGSALVEQCRLACGGHGFMVSSNLPILYGIATASCTYEGENTILHLQTARYLLKSWQQYMDKQPLSPTMQYLSHEKTPSQKWDNTPECIIRGFEQAAAGVIKQSVLTLQKYMSLGMSSEDAWNMASVQLVAASKAHGRAVICRVFWEQSTRLQQRASRALGAVLALLPRLYLAHWALHTTGDLLLFSNITGRDVQILQEQYEQLLVELRPNAVGLVDAYDYRDEELNSTLGSFDGRVYERLMAEALKSPLNAEPVNRSFHTHLKPFMQGKL